MDDRDQKFLDALLEIASEIRALRGMILIAIAPAIRNEDGVLTKEGHLRTEEQHPKD